MTTISDDPNPVSKEDYEHLRKHRRELVVEWEKSHGKRTEALWLKGLISKIDKILTRYEKSQK